MFTVSTDPNQPGTWKFSLFGYPIGVHWMFWVTAALLGGAFSADTPLRFQLLVIWVAVVFVSILVHEFGHAIFQRRYGGRPRILLWGFGGLAISDGRFTRNQSIVISLAGPVFGFLLGAIVWLIAKTLVPKDAQISIHLYFLIRDLLYVNIFWSLINLLPIHPLDGGQLLGHVMYGKKQVLRAKIGMGCAIVVGVAMSVLQGGAIFPLLMFGYLAYMNYQMVAPRWR